MTHLRQTTEVEIVDLDVVATKEEVLAALRVAIKGEAIISDDGIKITGLWPMRDGRQMATGVVPVTAAPKFSRIRVGWMQCRVRLQIPKPQRCFRCYGFGHGTRQCTCRRCSKNGHQEKQCEAGNDLCVACNRINAARVPHRPGSGSCAARKKAAAKMANNPSAKRLSSYRLTCIGVL